MLLKNDCDDYFVSVLGVNEITVSDRSIPQVFTLPDCHRCELLKEWLNNRGVAFDTKPFDTEAQTEFIMMNMFGNPPILQVSDNLASSEEMFSDEVLNEEKILEVLGIGEA